VWMLHGSCVSERPACSRSAGGLAASGAVQFVLGEKVRVNPTLDKLLKSFFELSELTMLPNHPGERFLSISHQPVFYYYCLW